MAGRPAGARPEKKMKKEGKRNKNKNEIENPRKEWEKKERGKLKVKKIKEPKHIYGAGSP